MTDRKGISKLEPFKYVIFLTGLSAIFITGTWIGSKTKVFNPLYSKHEIKKHLPQQEDYYRFKSNDVSVPEKNESWVLEYTIDPALQSTAEDLIAQYKPDMAALVALDASTGKVLAMVGENRVFDLQGTPVLKGMYPAASVFKVITAAAAVENKQAKSSTMIAYAGRDHTLYKSQVLKPEVKGWKRETTLRDAFARSINTVFGRLAVFKLGEKPIKNFADRFGFNQEIPFEFPVELSKSANPNTAYELAEMASGYTQENTMSPIHGALIAAAVANGGQMMEPYIVQSAYLKTGKQIYHAEPKVWLQTMAPETANELQQLMQQTVIAGTSRKSFKGFFKGTYRQLEVGGKTGSLTDQALKGKVDWFVGYAQAHGRKIAVSVMTMHKKYWTVKSSYLARKTFETAFSHSDYAKK